MKPRFNIKTEYTLSAEIKSLLVDFPVAKLFINSSKINFSQTSLIVQWLRIRPPVQGMWVRSLVQEESTCCGTAKLVSHGHQAHAPCGPEQGRPAHQSRRQSPNTASRETGQL